MNTTFRSAATTLLTFQTKPQVRPGLRFYFDFIFNVSTDPALMEATAPDLTVGLVILIYFTPIHNALRIDYCDERLDY